MKRQKYSNLGSPSNMNSASGLIRCHFYKLPSTQDYLSLWVSKTRPPAFTVVSADVQTGGRGQYGRQWEDLGGNLALSFIVYPDKLRADQQFLLQMWSAISIYDTLAGLGLERDRLRIKWPNDILFDGKKLAGILLQSSISGSYIRNAILGIGINVQSAPQSMPGVTSLFRECVFVSPAELREKILCNLYQSYQEVNFDRGVLAYRDIYHQRMWRYGEEVFFMRGNERGEGRIIGINSLGHLELACDGQLQRVTGSEVRFLRK